MIDVKPRVQGLSSCSGTEPFSTKVKQCPLFDTRTWRKVPILLTGVILAPGRRTVSTALYVLGLQGRGDFALFHHVLSRASWSSLAVSRVLLDQLVRHLVPTGPLQLAIDETLERRWGEKIEALGVYRGIGTRCARPTATSSRPRDCAGSA